MSYTSRKRGGFTIVELLITIIVIAILATISIVTYSGIQSRANDSVVQSDLKNITNKLEIYRVDKGRYPGSYTELVEANMKVSKAAYAVSPNSNFNLPYCTRLNASEFIIIAKSKSGKVFSASSADGLQEITVDVTWDSSTDQGSAMCTSLGYGGAISHGYYSPDTANTWRPWVNAS